MPQHPASRSSMSRSGNLFQKRVQRRQRPIDFWWQWPWSRIFGGPDCHWSREAGGEFFEYHTGVGDYLRFALFSPRSRDGASSRMAERQLGSQKTSFLPAFAAS